MTNKVTDLEQRQKALSPDESFIVQAPAGSGKTELLIQRYLSLLAKVEFPEEIIAITFTRKAAAEMRGRIIKAMEQAAMADAEKDGAAQQTYVLAKQALVQDKKYAWQLENNPGRLRIQTIDSLCASLTRQMPILARFGAQPETLDDATELYKEAAVATLAQLESGQDWSHAIATILTHLDNNLPRVRDMIASMLARRDQWLRNVRGDVQREELEAALKHIVNSTLKASQNSFTRELSDELVLLSNFAAENLQRGGKVSPIIGCLGLKELPQFDAVALNQWQGIVELLLTKEGAWRKQVNVKIGFPAAGNNKEETGAYKAMKVRMLALMAKLSEEESLRRQLVEIRNLPPIAYTEEEWEVVEALCILLVLADAQLRVLFAARNQIDFTGISQAAMVALGDEQNPTDLALHLDYRIQHILVDEYQDISINQYVLLAQLTAGWSSGDGHSLFLVGDPMQSIYRFREAEVGLFLNTWEHKRLGQVAITPLNISVNFRSDKRIVDWVNDSFSQILPGQANVERGAVNFTPAVAFHEQAEPNAVRFHPLIDGSNEQEAALLVQEIKQLQQEHAKDSIAILVRSRTHLQSIVPALKLADLGFRAIEIDAMGQQAEIQDLIALTRALDHLADRIAWLAILRAPWCGLTLADLLILAGDDRRLTLWQCMLDKRRLSKLSADGRNRLERTTTILQKAFAEQHRQAFRRWVQSVWMKLGGPATLNNVTDLENTQTFFKLLDQFDVGGVLTDRDEFMVQVNKLYAAPDTSADGNLQIMTIHRAKGLEFDTVVLPGLSRKSRSDENRLLLWSENPHQSHQDLLLAPVKEASEQEAPIYKFIKDLDKEKQRNEDGRLLYVAVTRAKKRLRLLASVKTKEDGEEVEFSKPLSSSLLAQLWPVVEMDCQQALKDRNNPEPVNDDKVLSSLPLKRLSPDWKLPDVPEGVAWRASDTNDVSEYLEEIEFEWAGESIKHVGTVVHQCLRWIAEDGIEYWGNEKIGLKSAFFHAVLKRLGVQNHELERATSLVRDALNNVIDDERGQWLLAGKYTEAWNEFGISGIYENKLVNVYLDRTFVDEEGVRWIVDYKTSPHKGPDRDAFLDLQVDRYREQLEKYASLVQAMDDRPVKLGLYFPLLKGWREWDYQ